MIARTEETMIDFFLLRITVLPSSHGCEDSFPRQSPKLPRPAQDNPRSRSRLPRSPDPHCLLKVKSRQKAQTAPSIATLSSCYNRLLVRISSNTYFTAPSVETYIARVDGWPISACILSRRYQGCFRQGPQRDTDVAESK